MVLGVSPVVTRALVSTPETREAATRPEVLVPRLFQRLGIGRREEQRVISRRRNTTSTLDIESELLFHSTRFQSAATQNLEPLLRFAHWAPPGTSTWGGCIS